MAFMFVRLGSSVAWKDRVVFTHTAVQTPALAVEAERIVAVYYLGKFKNNMGKYTGNLIAVKCQFRNGNKEARFGRFEEQTDENYLKIL